MNDEYQAMKEMAWLLSRRHQDSWKSTEASPWSDSAGSYKCSCSGDHDAWTCEWPTNRYNEVMRYMRAASEAWGEDHARVTNEEILANEASQKVAHGKALDLLKRTLSAAQLAELNEKGHFHVKGRDGFIYRLFLSLGHNVERVEGEKVLQRYCLVPKLAIPTPDKVLAQKLLLEADPVTFFKTANAYEP